MPAIGQLRVIGDAHPKETEAVFGFSPESCKSSKSISRIELLTATQTLRDAICANPDLTPASVYIETPWPGGEYTRCEAMGSFYMPGNEGLFTLDASSGTDCILTHYSQLGESRTVLDKRDVSQEAHIQRVGFHGEIEHVRIVRKPRRSTILPFLKQLELFLESCTADVVRVDMA